MIGGRPLKIKGRGFAYLRETGAPLPRCDFGFDAIPAVVEDDATLFVRRRPSRQRTRMASTCGWKKALLAAKVHESYSKKVRFNNCATKVDPPRGSAAGSLFITINGHGLRHASCGSGGTSGT